MKTTFTFAFSFLIYCALGQSSPSSSKSIDFGAAIGSSEGSFTAAWHINWHLGKNKKFLIGTGVHATAYFGSNQYYVTAPATLTSGGTGPGVIFKENITANMDSFMLAKPNVYALNALINLGYQITNKLSVGFNIDAIGFSFGGKKTGTHINGVQGQTESAKPTYFNLLLVSDNDRGSLNSDLYVRYALNEKWALKGGLQFLFTEYTTNTPVQQLPEPNDRFRNKSLMFMIGASIKL